MEPSQSSIIFQLLGLRSSLFIGLFHRILRVMGRISAHLSPSEQGERGGKTAEPAGNQDPLSNLMSERDPFAVAIVIMHIGENSGGFSLAGASAMKLGAEVSLSTAQSLCDTAASDLISARAIGIPKRRTVKRISCCTL